MTKFFKVPQDFLKKSKLPNKKENKDDKPELKRSNAEPDLKTYFKKEQ